LYNKPKAYLNLGVSYFADKEISKAKRILKLRKRFALKANRDINHLIKNPKHFVSQLKMQEIKDANETITETPDKNKEKY
jgi:hypothetical protein